MAIDRQNIFGLMSIVFANGPGNRDLIQGQIISKTQKMVLDSALLNTQHYKVKVKSPPLHPILVAIERGAFR